MSFLSEAKDYLRVSTADTDVEVQDLIDAARQDLILSGMLSTKALSEVDPLIRRYVFGYVKANFGWDNPEAIRMSDANIMLKRHLLLSPDYTVAT
jgi:hypothetical protein